MPRILHSVDSLVWNEERKEPVLIVPESYWFRHKKIIYKFTLEFHRPARNADEFNYSKELIRVIRHILKYNPPQGQHYRTKNLFIEFNHTTWTSTDKMFAMGKGAEVYQQAFILVIKVLRLVPPSNTSSHPNPSLVLEEPKPTQPDSVLTSTTSRDKSNNIPGLNRALPKDVEEDLDPRNRSPKSPKSKIEEPSKMQEDSTCLPYLYITEREMENSRIKCIQKNQGDATSKSDEDGVTDPMVLQCLDMTDMVMKGQMFTLRQEENSVKILEDTTGDILDDTIKIEVDEVLENSEEVETKEGDPCLLNSNLLKLESKITNMDRSKTSLDLSKLYQSQKTEVKTEIVEVTESENLPVHIPDEDTKSWPSSTKSEKRKRKGESLRCDRIVKRKKVNDEVQSSGREMSNKVGIRKLIGALSKSVRVVVDRLDPKFLRS